MPCGLDGAGLGDDGPGRHDEAIDRSRGYTGGPLTARARKGITLRLLTFKQYTRKLRLLKAARVDHLLIKNDGGYLLLQEGRWLKADFDREIRMDRNTHMRTGDIHFHFHDRKGNELYAMANEGKPSHGSKSFRLTKAQAEVVRAYGGTVPPDRMVEAILVGSAKLLLLG
jgi:hypothetical protein